jgi:hypothetical protein
MKLMMARPFGMCVLVLLAGAVFGTGKNLPPRAEMLVVNVTLGVPVSLTLKASDPNGDPLTYTILGGPSHGQLDGKAPHLTYTPERGFVGVDEIRFAVTDPYGAFDLGTVRLQVSPGITPHRIGQPDRSSETVLASLAVDLVNWGVQAWYIFTELSPGFSVGQPIPVLLPPGGEPLWVGMCQVSRGEAQFVPVVTDWNPLGWLRVYTDSCAPGSYILTVVKDQQAFSFLISLGKGPGLGIHLAARQPE